MKLKEIAGEKGSNYINACFVNVGAKCLRYEVLFRRCFHVLFFLAQGYNREDTYIASQGMRA